MYKIKQVDACVLRDISRKLLLPCRMPHKTHEVKLRACLCTPAVTFSLVIISFLREFYINFDQYLKTYFFNHTNIRKIATYDSIFRLILEYQNFNFKTFN